MKIHALAFLLLLPAAVFADPNCDKNSDACSAGNKKLSPFLQAVSAAQDASAQTSSAPTREPREKLAGGRVTAGRKKASMRQAELSTAPAAVEVSSAAPAAPADGGSASSPAWLIFVAAGIAGLYFYINGGKRRGRRK